MVGDNAGPHERAWLCSGFRVLECEGMPGPLVLAPAGEVPVLVLPPAWARDAERREIAAGFGLCDLYWQRYGWLSLVRAIRAWDRIAAEAGAGREGFAAD